MTQIIPDTENISQIAELREEVISKRDSGEVLLEIKKLVPDIAPETDENIITLVNSFVMELGLSGIGDRWKEISQEDAQKILIFALTKNLAYSEELMPLGDANKISDRLIKLFKNNRLFFTNATFQNSYSRLTEWNSITESTFDTGVVIVSNERIGIIWVQDED